MKFDLIFIFFFIESLLSCSFDEIHCSPIVYMNHMDPIVLDFAFLQQEDSKKPQSILSLLSKFWKSFPCACSDLDLKFLNALC